MVRLNEFTEFSHVGRSRCPSDSSLVLSEMDRIIAHHDATDPNNRTASSTAGVFDSRSRGRVSRDL